MKSFLVVLTLAAVGLFFGATAAMAATWQKTTDGSSVLFNNDPDGSGAGNDERFHVCDTSSDGHAVYAEYAFDGGSLTKHNWGGGNGTCKNFDHQWSENKVVKFRSCEEINNWPNDCSGYESGGRS
ncbi:hypothetical protein [Nocardioides marmorisolisilvae]|uniref:hypothetical protein n=1 Tax=Nocardioides marmorisolisilvae TaxID=1542737 RepID=UPI0011CE3CE8|nr:hypothetical protein [Nocardioides marmorisolisilvae]